MKYLVTFEVKGCIDKEIEADCADEAVEKVWSEVDFGEISSCPDVRVIECEEV